MDGHSTAPSQQQAESRTVVGRYHADRFGTIQIFLRQKMVKMLHTALLWNINDSSVQLSLAAT